MNWKKLLEYLPLEDKNKAPESKEDMEERIFHDEFVGPLEMKHHTRAWIGTLVTIILFVLSDLTTLHYSLCSWILYILGWICFAILVVDVFRGSNAMEKATKKVQDVLNEGEQQGEKISFSDVVNTVSQKISSISLSTGSLSIDQDSQALGIGKS